MTEVILNFVIGNAHTKPGENVHLVGSIPQLGSWKDINSISLKTTHDIYPTWRTKDEGVVKFEYNVTNFEALLVKNCIEYKYLVKNKVSIITDIFIFCILVGKPLFLGEKRRKQSDRR